MEKNVLNLSSMKVSVQRLAMLALITVSALFAVQANGTSPILNNMDIAVSPEGIIQDEMIFSVQYHNATEDKLQITLRDENGYKLYSSVFTGKNLNKMFKVHADLGKVYLTIRNPASGVEQKFVISPKESDKVLITSAY